MVVSPKHREPCLRVSEGEAISFGRRLCNTSASNSASWRVNPKAIG
jgi:hypothetical protein